MAKNAKVQPANDVGHNSRELTEAEEKALFFHHVRKDIAHQAAIKAAQDARKPDRKMAQADGFALSDLDYAIKAMNAEDKVTITDRYGMHGKVLHWLGLLPGYQSDFFADRAPAIERIEKQGELAGLAAGERESGYEKGCEEDLVWLRGYDAGQAIVRDNLESAMTKRNADKAETAELIKGGADPDFEDPFDAADPALEAAE